MARRSTLLPIALLLGSLVAAAVGLEPAHAQGAGPALESATTADLDLDGRVDAVRLVFDAGIDERALALSDLSVTEYGVLAYEMPSTSILLLHLDERPGYDSDATPTLTYKVTSPAGDEGSGTATATDGAPPVLVSVLAVAGDTQVRARFSEPVVGAAPEPEASELDYRGGSGGARTITDLVRDATDLLLTLDAEVTADDLALDALAPTTALADAAGNVAVVAAHHAADAASLEGPRVVETVADVGSPDVRVRFNVPLAASPGDGSFNLDEDESADGEPRTVASVATGGAADELVVRLSGPVRPEDVRSLEPALLIAAPDRFQAQGVRTGETLGFQPDPAPLQDGVAPRVVAVATQDRNRNGLIDAMLVTLSEPARATCSDGIEVALYDEGTRIPYVLDESGGVPRAIAGAPEQLLVRVQERTTQEADTGLVPELTVGACGNGDLPVEDLAEVPDGAGGVRGNPVLPVGLALVEETDGAAPVVLGATSKDRDQDGLPDAYAIRFSEPMVQAAFDPARWSVEGRDVTEGLWDGDAVLLLGHSEDPDGGSSALPAIAYDGGEATDLRDAAGNPLQPFDRGNFPYVDDADPRILRAFGDVGQDRIRVEFSEPVEGVTDPETGGGPGRPLQESDFFYDDLGTGGAAGIVSVEHNAGASVAVLVLNAPLEAGDVSADAAAGDAVRAIQGHVREANGDAAADRAPVSGEPVRLLHLDVDAPGAPEDVRVEEGVDRVTLTFTAGADDAGDAGSGAVTGYRVYVQEEPTVADPDAPTAEELEALRAGGTWATFTLGAPTSDGAPAANPAAPGTNETLTVLGLCPGTPYHVAFEAVDDFDNPSAPAFVGGADGVETLADDTSAVVDEAALRILSSTHRLDADGFAVESTEVLGSVTWEGFGDPEACGIEYLWVVDDDPGRELTDADLPLAVDAPDGAHGAPGTVYQTTAPGARFDLSGVERPAARTLHVAAFSAGGLSRTVHYPLDLVLPIDCTPDTLLLPDVEAVHEGGLTTVTWGEYREVLPEDVALAGYQVWMRPAQGSQLLRATVEAGSDAFEARRVLDDLHLRGGDAYLVTAYFSDDLCRFDWDGAALTSGSDPGGPSTEYGANPATVVAEPPVVPTWAWVTLTVVAMLVAAGLVLFFALRHQRLDDSWLEEPEDPHDPDDPFGPDPLHDLDAQEHDAADPFGGGSAPDGGTGLGAAPPDLNVTCPACTHRFQVQGHRPLSIVCPNCSASGTLE